MKNISRAAFLILGLTAPLVLSSPAAQAQDTKMNGLFCHNAVIEYSAPPLTDGTCPPGLEKSTQFNICKGAGKNQQTMQLRLNKDGTLDFGISVWQSNFNCGLSGKAVPHEKGWRLEKYMDDPDPAARCRLDITRSASNVITLRTAPKADCRFACGAGIRLDGVQFPLNGSRIGPAQDAVFQSDEAVYTMNLCPAAK